MSSLFARARAHLDHDIDPEAQAELAALLARAEAGEREALLELEDRFSGPLTFGTAGLRGLLGAGENRMNRAVVVRATAGLVAWVLEQQPDARARGIVVGRDGRRLSEALQRDAAEVIAAAGIPVHFLPGTTPTPVTAFAVEHLGAAAGIMVTASHNPPAYNGYKVYWGNGAQIIPPHDAGIAARIDAAPGARSVPRLDLEEARSRGLVRDASAVEAEYLAAVGRLVFAPDAPVGDLSIAYSALHGVGERVFRKAMAARGFTRLVTVAEQAEPDGRFPTVAFPNPEEPGALDLVLALAKARGAELVLVNDPDADRLGAAVLDPARGEYVVLGGNDIGVLLAHHLLTATKGEGTERLVMATLVSSRLLAQMARDLGVRYEETLTGFKWIANESLRLASSTGARFLFGYEEALGYTVRTVVRDKDGISAAMVLAELAAVEKAHGRTLLDRLDALRRRHGLFVGRQKSLTLPGRDGLERIAAAMAALRRDPPRELAGVPLARRWDLSDGAQVDAEGRVERDERWRGDVLVYELLGGGRVSVRPSGTEPKIKLYLEVAERPAEGEALAVAETRGKARLDALERDLLARTGLG
jgi:phosphomannomutase